MLKKFFFAMDSLHAKNLLKDLEKFLSSNINLINIAELAATYNNLEIFDFNLDTPIKYFPENGKIDKISLKLLPIDFNHLLPAKIKGDGNCLMNSLSFIYTASEEYSAHFRLATLLELMANYEFYLSIRLFEQDYIYSDHSINNNSTLHHTNIKYNKEGEFINELRSISQNHSFCSMVAIYGLASVIGHPIQSIYPPTSIKFLKEIFNSIINPRPESRRCNEEIFILWSVTDLSLWDLHTKFPSPNHFVACFEYYEVM